jgi:hypothetical protein
VFSIIRRTDEYDRHKQKMKALPIDPGISSYVIIGKSPGFCFVLLGPCPMNALRPIGGMLPIRQQSQL